jgi:hypothetical protein
MEFNFRGLLIPPQKIVISEIEFHDYFVGAFPSSTTRLNLYAVYQEYTRQFKEQIGQPFSQWIAGSFTTLKTNPADLDIVTLADQNILLGKEKTVRDYFQAPAWKARGIDSYLLGIRSPDAPDYPIYRSDYVYWMDQFLSTRKTRRGEQHPRGFAEINF